jgi:hypothetical protein
MYTRELFIYTKNSVLKNLIEPLTINAEGENSLIVIIAGMEKSGSAFYFNLVNDLLIAAGKDDVREIKKKYHLESMLELKNCNIRELTGKKLITLFKLHLLRKSFVVKTHFPPTRLLKFFITLKAMKAIYIYRDPRDVILSAIDHGKKHREKGLLGEYFARFVTIENSISLVKDYLAVWEKWTNFKNVLLVKYEDLVSDTLAELKRAADYLHINMETQRLEEIIRKYQPENLKNLGFPLHYNKGKPGRYKERMSGEEMELCNKHLGHYIERMGYSLEKQE